MVKVDRGLQARARPMMPSIGPSRASWARLSWMVLHSGTAGMAGHMPNEKGRPKAA
jgi:hypothetical protein